MTKLDEAIAAAHKERATLRGAGFAIWAVAVLFVVLLMRIT